MVTETLVRVYKYTGHDFPIQEEKTLIYQEKDGQAHEDVRTLKWLVKMPLMMIMLHEHVEGSVPVCEFGILSKTHSNRLPGNEFDAFHDNDSVHPFGTGLLLH
jgi:hypothetical protein